MLIFFQIEQFIETLFPKQDPKKLAQEAKEKQTQEPGLTASETAIMVAVVLGVLLTMTGTMVSHTLHLPRAMDSANLMMNRLALLGSLAPGSTILWPTRRSCLAAALLVLRLQ